VFMKKGGFFKALEAVNALDALDAFDVFDDALKFWAMVK
jgi:hypothetical protein